MSTRQPVSGGLHIPKDVGVAESAAAQYQAEWNTIDRVNAQLAKWGIHENEEPQLVCPKITPALLMTSDVTEFSSLFASQLRWFNYASRLLADIRAGGLQVKNQMEDIAVATRTALRKTNEGLPKVDRMSVGEINDAVENDPSYRALKVQHQEIEQFRIKLDAWSEELDRNLKTVSRQIENRRAESESGRREANMPGDSRGAWRPRTPGG